MSAQLGTIRPAALPAPGPSRAVGRLADLRRDIRIVALIAFGLSGAVEALVLLKPLLMMHVVDGVLISRNSATLATLAVIVIAGFLLAGLLRYLRSTLLAVVAERAARRLELGTVTATVLLAVRGDPPRARQALSDVSEVRRLLGGSLASDMFDLVSVPFALVFLWVLHPLFFAVAAVGLGLKLVIALVSARATAGPLEAAAEAAGASTRELSSALSQRDTVLGLGMMPAILRRWAPGWMEGLRREEAAGARAEAFRSMADMVGYAMRIGIVAAGAYLVVNGEISPGAKFAALIMVGLVSGPVMFLLDRWRSWASGMLAWQRLRRLIEDTAEPAPAPPDRDALPGLVLEGVAVRPPGAERDLVADLTLRLAPGEAWLLLGPNGVGKTTLLRAVVGLDPPHSGRILLDGQDTWAAERSAIGPRIGYLPQAALLLEASVLDNIGRFSEGGATPAVNAARLAGVHGTLGRLHRGYESPAGPSGGLSGGQQRMVALSRAMFGSPRLLVLDEPEAGLDAAGREALRGAVRAAKEAGAVVLLVSHDPRPWLAAVDGGLRLHPDGTWEARPLAKETA